MPVKICNDKKERAGTNHLGWTERDSFEAKSNYIGLKRYVKTLADFTTQLSHLMDAL